MASDSSYDKLCDLVASMTCGATRNSVKRYFKSLYKIFVEQLYLNGKFYIQNIGTFELVQRESRIIRTGDPVNKGTKYINVKPTYNIVFRMSDSLNRIINDCDFNIKQKQVKKPKTQEDSLVEILNNSRKWLKEREKNKNGETKI